MFGRIKSNTMVLLAIPSIWLKFVTIRDSSDSVI